MNAVELPHTETFPFHDPEIGVEGVTVEFRLIYQGKLPAQSSGGGGGHVREKHEIRRQFHSQLKMLWQDHPALRQWKTHQDESGRTHANVAADRYEKCGRRFLPLINLGDHPKAATYDQFKTGHCEGLRHTH